MRDYTVIYDNLRKLNIPFDDTNIDGFIARVRDVYQKTYAEKTPIQPVLDFYEILTLDGGVNYMLLESESEEECRERTRKEFIELYGYDPHEDTRNSEEILRDILKLAID